MYSVKFTAEFELWLNSIKGSMTCIRLSKRLDKAQRGNLDDVKPVGEGISEMRKHFGSGRHMYYVQKENTLIVMLGGGEKSTQQADIERTIALSKKLKD